MMWIQHDEVEQYYTTMMLCLCCRVPQNCPRRYNLLAFDPDGDHVRCRFGLGQNNECGICNQPNGFTLDQV